MENKNDSENLCLYCKRIIADPNNKIHLCPNCQKKAFGIFAGLAGIISLLTLGGPKILIDIAKDKFNL